MKKLRQELGRILLFVALLGIDQWTKWLAVTRLKGQNSYVLIPNVLEFSYIENTGAAFSSFLDKNTLLLVVGVVLASVLTWLYTKIPGHKKWAPLKWFGVVMLAGAVGNLIDRVVHGFVVDFIYFVPIDFPKFNIADSCLVVALIIVFILLCFVYKEKDLAEIVLWNKKQKTTKNKNR